MALVYLERHSVGLVDLLLAIRWVYIDTIASGNVTAAYAPVISLGLRSKRGRRQPASRFGGIAASVEGLEIE